MNTRMRRIVCLVSALAVMLVVPLTAQARLDPGIDQPVRSEPTSVRIAPVDGFSWADAGIGAAAVLGAVLVAAGAGFTLRKRSLPAHS